MKQNADRKREIQKIYISAFEEIIIALFSKFFGDVFFVQLQFKIICIVAYLHIKQIQIFTYIMIVI